MKLTQLTSVILLFLLAHQLTFAQKRIVNEVNELEWNDKNVVIQLMSAKNQRVAINYGKSLRYVDLKARKLTTINLENTNVINE